MTIRRCKIQFLKDASVTSSAGTGLWHKIMRNNMDYFNTVTECASRVLHAADPARAFPTVGSVATTVGGGSPSPASGDISTPNSTPSPSPSPTNGQQVMAKTIGMQVVHPIEPFGGYQPSLTMTTTTTTMTMMMTTTKTMTTTMMMRKTTTNLVLLHEVGVAGTAGAAGGTAGGIAGRFCFIINGDDEDVVESQF
ncbi:hypothetical protein HZH68_001636 [Vespula germanica]|uniref:Uncharacterized protein n=1 Tax=Vespula germanica TaxID=30212 RepID=A0A834U736_VESGE|nr:hypothetical protein HZH68_001636 [Vespula germanica]